MQIYSLYELNEYIKRVLALNFQEAIWLHCEIAEVNESRGHFYLNLIEKSSEQENIIAQSSAIIWASKYRSLKRSYKNVLDSLLQNGMSVLLQIKVDYDERFGLKLLIEDIDPSYTIGQMELKRQEIISDLQKGNLLDLNKQRPLPLVIQRVAIISSENAAGLQDYLNQVANNSYGYQLSNDLFPTAMQGGNVEKEVLVQLKKIARLKENYDALIIIRGGGAKLDLAAFDNFKICKAIAEFPLPVLVGIGHEIDETVLDIVAHTSLKTPTAVADYLINRLLAFESRIIEYKSFIFNKIAYNIQAENGTLSHLQKMIKLQTTNSLRTTKTTLEQIKQRLPIASNHYIDKEKQQLQQLEKICQILAPETALKRGFSITTIEGKVINDAKQVVKGTVLKTQLLKGSIKSIVE